MTMNKNNTNDMPEMYTYIYLVTLSDDSQWVLSHTEDDKDYIHKRWSMNQGDAMASDMFDYMESMDVDIDLIEDMDKCDYDPFDHTYWVRMVRVAMLEMAEEMVDEGRWIHNLQTIKDLVTA